MDEQAKREILDPIITAIAASSAASEERHTETHGLVEKVILDQLEIRSDYAGLVERVVALEGARNAHEGRLSGHERKLVDGIAEAKKIASDVRSDTAATLGAVEERYEDLSSGVQDAKSAALRVEAELAEIKKDVGAKVLEALGSHVADIEAAAHKLTNAPQVKVAASIGGAFAGTAFVAAVIEIIKHL